MPRPLALCLEDLRAPVGSDRYLRCVAIPGRRPGLGLRRDGVTVWKAEEGLACELWVSADDRLIAYRREGAPAVLVRRAGRSLSAPEGKPVVLMDQDELEVAGRALRVHVHGAAPAVQAPSILAARAGAAARLTAVAAAAVALATAPACDKLRGGNGPIEVREMPPAPPPQLPPDAEPDIDAGGTDAAPESGDPSPGPAIDGGGDARHAVDAAAAGTATAVKAKTPPIEVRNRPPDPID